MRMRPWCWPNSDTREAAAGTYKGSFGFCPLLAYLDRGQAPGEPLAGLLRPGNAAPGAADDLIALVELALEQLPAAAADQPFLVRSDSAGASTRLAWHLRQRGVGFSVGMPIDAHVREAILAQPEPAWTPAVDPDGQRRDGAEVCELTGWIDLNTWPAGTRAICRRKDAHPGAQLRFTDHDGHRFQVFLTDQPDTDMTALELRHRQRARIEDRIRGAKATGLRNLPFDRWRRNSVWLELVLAAQDLLCRTQALLLDGHLAVAEPKTLRYRLLHVAARIVHHARRRILRLQRTWPWTVDWLARSPGCGPCRCAADPRHRKRSPRPPAAGPTRHATHPTTTPILPFRQQPLVPSLTLWRPNQPRGRHTADRIRPTAASTTPAGPILKSRGYDVSSI